MMQQRYMLAGLGFKSPETRRATGFDEFLAALEKETLAFGKPVVYVHGDSHIFRVDKPLFGSTSRRFIENFTQGGDLWPPGYALGAGHRRSRQIRRYSASGKRS